MLVFFSECPPNSLTDQYPPPLLSNKVQKNPVFISFSLVAKIRELYLEEDGKYMGYKRKAID